MPDLVNPYANPYLPSFVNQRPKVNEPLSSVPTFGNQQVFSQIHDVKGFQGAREYASRLSNGSSEIVSESDPNTARIYVVAKDANGAVFIEAFNLVHVEEPKPITMDDLNTKMNMLLDRMNKMEEEKRNGKPNYSSYGKDSRRPGSGQPGPDSRGPAESSGGDASGNTPK